MMSRPEQAISFRDYMQMCLYHPEFGYYTGSRPKVGKNGDFYTSASIGGIMGEMLAAYMADWRKGAEDKPWTLVEWGGGSGELAVQILSSLRESAPQLYLSLSYVSIEASGYHRELQRQALAEHRSKMAFQTAEEWLSGGPYAHCLVLSNELLDAFPVHRLKARGGGWFEIHVSVNPETGQFIEKEFPLGDDRLRAYIGEERISMREGQIIEVNLEADRWIREVASSLAEGSRIVTIDYGDEGGELYAEHRMNGTLMCYRLHHAFDDPYRFPGEQDMTAHVNFSACIRAGRENGLESRLMTQKQFLLECGILQRLQNHPGLDPFSPEARKNRAIRQLLLSDQMSELFKVLVQTKRAGD
nr:SAM-dependent methyltransferase [Paenibacillus hamazuiensis]